MRALTLGVWLVLVAGCPDSHGRGGDAGADAACGLRPLPRCGSCSGDVLVDYECEDRAWVCPSGTTDIATCTCSGSPPYPGCTCRGGRWLCSDIACPADLDPLDPGACRYEPASCRTALDLCVGGATCECRAGRWDCAIGPQLGEACSDEGRSCGECCLSPGGPGIAAVRCSGGVWEPGACDAVVCDGIVCPAETMSALGTACTEEGQRCGNPCCGTAITCTAGRFVRGPDASCECSGDFTCGEGSCRADQACRSACGPTDGTVFTCISLPDDCRDCACLALPPNQTCSMEDGRVYLAEIGFCG